MKREKKKGADTNLPLEEKELIDGGGDALREGRWMDSPRWRKQKR